MGQFITGYRPALKQAHLVTMARRLEALISIHDVAPEVMPQVEALCNMLKDAQAWPVTLLCIPNRDWSKEHIDQLRTWSKDEGCELAGHGWNHACEQIKGWRHKLHSITISRNVAEHFCYEQRELKHMIDQNFEWFQQHELPCPTLYVPPAWAAVALSPQMLRHLQFSAYETLSGVHTANLHYRLPLAGFEADNSSRALLLRLFNRVNIAYARICRLPIRISIHPHDAQLKLSAQLKATLLAVKQPQCYAQLIEPS